MNKFIKNSRLCFSHFQTKLLCAFLLCTLIPIFIIGGISYAVSYNIAEDKKKLGMSPSVYRETKGTQTT